MKIVLIGAGNVATHLGIALQKAGCLILQVYSRTEESASALAARLSVDYTIVPDEIRRDADLYIVALKDAVLRQLAPVLVKGRELDYGEFKKKTPCWNFRSRYGLFFRIYSTCIG